MAVCGPYRENVGPGRVDERREEAVRVKRPPDAAPVDSVVHLQPPVAGNEAVGCQEQTCELCRASLHSGRQSLSLHQPRAKRSACHRGRSCRSCTCSEYALALPSLCASPTPGISARADVSRSGASALAIAIKPAAAPWSPFSIARVELVQDLPRNLESESEPPSPPLLLPDHTSTVSSTMSHELPPSANWYSSSACDWNAAAASSLVAFATKNEVRLFDPEALVFRGALLGHTDRVTSVEFCLPGAGGRGGGDMCTTGSADQSVRVWDCESLACLHKLAGGGGGGHTKEVAGVSVRMRALVCLSRTWPWRTSRMRACVHRESAYTSSSMHAIRSRAHRFTHIVSAWIHTNIRQACRDGSATIVSADRGGGVIVWDYTTHSVTKMAPNQNTVSGGALGCWAIPERARLPHSDRATIFI